MFAVTLCTTTVLNTFCCRTMEWDYLSFRMWIGLWSGLILIILVAVDASALVCYITRFTEENFATLIAFIFIYKVNMDLCCHSNCVFLKQMEKGRNHGEPTIVCISTKLMCLRIWGTLSKGFQLSDTSFLGWHLKVCKVQIRLEGCPYHLKIVSSTFFIK